MAYGRKKRSLVKNAADSDQVFEAERSENTARDVELEDLRQILSSIGGRRFVSRYIRECGVYDDLYTGNEGTVYLMGQRSVGIKLINDARQCSIELYLKMLTENVYLEEGLDV